MCHIIMLHPALYLQAVAVRYITPCVVLAGCGSVLHHTLCCTCRLWQCVTSHPVLYLQAVAVCQMVVPRIAPGQVAQFFWEHVQRDLQVLQRVLGRSADDVFLVLHHVCHLMAWTQRAGWHKDQI